MEEEARLDLPNDEIIVRGGRMSLDTLRNAAETFQARFPDHGYAVSGWSFPGAEEADAADLFPTDHRHYRCTTAGELRGAGFAVRRSGRYGHVTIKLPGELTDDGLERLRACFSEPRVRPKFEE